MKPHYALHFVGPSVCPLLNYNVPESLR